MSIAQTLEPRKTVKYKDIYVRIAFTLFAGYTVVSAGKFYNFFEALNNQKFVITLALNLITSFAVICLVRYITKKLDQKYPWEEAPLHRLLSQVFLGAGLGIFVSYIGASTQMYLTDGFTLATNRWYDRYFWMVAALVTLLNFYYLCWYLCARFEVFEIYRKQPAIPLPKAIVEDLLQPEVEPAIVIETTAEQKLSAANSKILLVRHENGVNIIYTEDGIIPSTLSLKDINKDLSPIDYEHLERSCIFLRSNIHEMRKNKEGGYDVYLKIPKEMVVWVSERQGRKLLSFLRKG